MTSKKILMSTVAVAAIAFALFASAPVYAQCADQVAQATDQRDPHDTRFAQIRAIPQTLGLRKNSARSRQRPVRPAFA